MPYRCRRKCKAQLPSSSMPSHTDTGTLNLIFESESLKTEILCGLSNQVTTYHHFTNVKPNVEIKYLLQKQQLLPHFKQKTRDLPLALKLQEMTCKTQDSSNGEFFNWLHLWSYKATGILQILKSNSNLSRELWSGKSLVEKKHEIWKETERTTY